MPKQMGIRELRNGLTSAVRRVRAGETIEVTHQGVPVAVLAPVPQDRLGQLIAAGEATPGRPTRRRLKRHPPTTGITASEALEADRAGG